MKRSWAWAAAAAAVAALASAPATAQIVEGVAAIVNDQAISTYDVRQRATLLIASSGIQATAESRQRASQQALRDLIDERLQLQETHHYDIAITDAQINTQLESIARQNNTTVPELTGQMAASGINPQTLREQIRADIAWRRLISGRYGSRVRISPTQISDTQARIAQSATRTQYQISEIFFPAESEAEFAEAQGNATRLLQEMQRGAPFPLVARQFSAAPSAAAGGDIGWMSAGELTTEIQSVADRLQPGQVSLPIRTAQGIYIIALRDRRAGASAASITRVGLRQITAPAANRSLLERAARRISGCDNLSSQLSSVTGAETVDLGVLPESELSAAVRARIAGVQAGSASPVEAAGEQASAIVVCSRETNTEGLPSRTEIENRLYEQELSMLSQRYLRDLRREATIITR